MTRLKTRDALKRYLHGDGIEIGALHKPLDLSGQDIARIRYVDRLPVAVLRQHYPELNDLALVEPDILDDGGRLDQIADGSLDFIVANHLIEHVDNPLSTLVCWHRKLRPGGVIYMAVPDKTRTFDRDRPLTPLSHLTEDFAVDDETRAGRNHAHFVEVATFTEGRVGEDAIERVRNLMARAYSIHHHVFTHESFSEMLSHVTNKMEIPYEVLDHSETFPDGEEFIFILKKKDRQSLAWLRRIWMKS